MVKKYVAHLILLIIILALSAIGGSSVYLTRTYPLTSANTSAMYYWEHLLHPHVKMQKESIGFLPYWRIDDSKYTRLDLITEVNYFGLFVNKEGEFVKVINGETNPGKREWESQTIKDLITKTHINGAKFTLSIICQDNNDIESILDKQEAQRKLIINIINEVKSRNLDGINVDFEYLGTPDDKYRQEFTEFSKKLKSALKDQNSEIKLEISVQPQATRKSDIIDFRALTPVYDNFIGMSYDYYNSASEIAGPIAPMTGFKENKYFFDVTSMYEGLEKLLPKEKILMGVPHYGWDWAVEDGKTIQSPTFSQNSPEGYAAVISYARAKEFKNFKKNQCFFDSYAMEPWCWYTDSKTKADHQVWFENTKSIGIKYDFVNKQDLGGIAIWVLGYDTTYPDLWDMMKDKFSKK
ncbi:MAG TPA: glycosyl hydrolase family 18 protein [Candidatus Saccharimonadales bacterium]|nr:glycosyl hydrolase family 18 protein [Candidatus Saccharimonadales bacterium]